MDNLRKTQILKYFKTDLQNSIYYLSRNSIWSLKSIIQIIP